MSTIDTLYENLRKEIDAKLEDIHRIEAREKILTQAEATLATKNKTLQERQDLVTREHAGIKQQQLYIDKQNEQIKLWQGTDAKLEEKKEALIVKEAFLKKQQEVIDAAQERIDALDKREKDLIQREAAVQKSYEGLKIQRDEMVIQQEANKRTATRLQQIADSLQPK